MLREIKTLLFDIRDIKRANLISIALVTVGYNANEILKYQDYILEEVKKGEQSPESILNSVRCRIMTDRKLKTS